MPRGLTGRKNTYETDVDPAGRRKADLKVRLYRLRVLRALVVSYLAALIDCTAILFVFASRVPVTLTRCAANFSGVF